MDFARATMALISRAHKYIISICTLRATVCRVASRSPICKRDRARADKTCARARVYAKWYNYGRHSALMMLLLALGCRLMVCFWPRINVLCVARWVRGHKINCAHLKQTAMRANWTNGEETEGTGAMWCSSLCVYIFILIFVMPEFQSIILNLSMTM